MKAIRIHSYGNPELMQHDIDVVHDTIGGPTQEASWGVMKPGGILVATAMPPPRRER